MTKQMKINEKNTMKKNILFIHQNFPGQFRHIIQHLAKRGDVNLLGIGLDTAPGMGSLIPQIKYKLHRVPTPQTHQNPKMLPIGKLNSLKKTPFQPKIFTVFTF